MVEALRQTIVELEGDDALLNSPEPRPHGLARRT